MKKTDSGEMDRVDKNGETDKASKADKSGKSDRAAKTDKSGKTDKAAKPGRGGKAEEITFAEYFAAKAELDAVRKEYGIEPKEGKISRMISNFFDKRESRQLQLVGRKKYLLLAFFTGWFGGHRFYAKQWVSAVFYLIFFWTGVPLAMTIIDIMAAVPKEVDENGNIYI